MRKYQYRTRQAAEDAARACDDRAFLNSVAFNAALDGSIQWLGGQYGETGSYYRLGCIHRIAETMLIVQHCCPDTGQSSHATAYHEEWLQEELGRLTLVGPTDELGRGYREGLYELRRMVNDLHKQAA